MEIEKSVNDIVREFIEDEGDCDMDFEDAVMAMEGDNVIELFECALREHENAWLKNASREIKQEACIHENVIRKCISKRIR